MDGLYVRIRDAWKKLDVPGNIPFEINYQISDVTDIASKNISFTKTLSLPKTPNNDSIFENIWDTSGSGSLDTRLQYPSYLIKGGYEVFRGVLVIDRVNSSISGAWEVSLSNEIVKIIDKLENITFDQIDFRELKHETNFANVLQSWENPKSPYYYPLVDYNYNWNVQNLREGVVPTELKPALSVEYVWNKLFEFSGFSYQSKILQEDRVLSPLYILSSSKELLLDPEFNAKSTFRAGLSSTYNLDPRDIALRGTSVEYLELPGTYTSGGGPVINREVRFNNVDNIDGNFDQNELFNTTNFSYVHKDARLNHRFNFAIDITVYEKYQTQTDGGDLYVRFMRSRNPITGEDVPNGYPIRIINQPNAEIKDPWIQPLPIIDDATNLGAFLTKPTLPVQGLYSPTAFFNRFSEFAWNHYSVPPILEEVNMIAQGGSGDSEWKRYRGVVTSVFLDGKTPETAPLFVGERVWVEILTAYKRSYYESTLLPDAADGQVPFIIHKENTFFFNELNSEQILLDGGFPSDIRSVFPRDKKTLDFFNDIVKMYNLYIDTDPRDPNLLLIETREDYYKKGVTRDWTKYLDNNVQIDSQIIAQRYKDIKFTYAQDGDLLNSDYRKSYSREYGDVIYSTGNKWNNETKVIKLSYSPTPVKDVSGSSSSNFVIPFIVSENSSGKRGEYVGKNMRIVQRGENESLRNGDYWSLKKPDGSLEQLTYFPFTGHFNKALNGTSDINWGMPQEIYYNSNKINNNGLFERYWRSYVEEITDAESRLVTATFILPASEVYALKLCDLIRVERLLSGTHNLFKINKITWDYNTEIAEVELIKSQSPGNTKRKCFSITGLPEPTSSINRWIRSGTVEINALEEFTWGTGGGFTQMKLENVRQDGRTKRETIVEPLPGSSTATPYTRDEFLEELLKINETRLPVTAERSGNKVIFKIYRNGIFGEDWYEQLDNTLEFSLSYSGLSNWNTAISITNTARTVGNSGSSIWEDIDLGNKVYEESEIPRNYRLQIFEDDFWITYRYTGTSFFYQSNNTEVTYRVVVDDGPFANIYTLKNYDVFINRMGAAGVEANIDGDWIDITSELNGTRFTRLNEESSILSYRTKGVLGNVIRGGSITFTSADEALEPTVGKMVKIVCDDSVIIPSNLSNNTSTNVPSRVLRVEGKNVINTGTRNTIESNNVIVTGDQNFIGRDSNGSIIMSSGSTIENATASIISSDLSTIHTGDNSVIIGGIENSISNSNDSLIIGSESSSIDQIDNAVIVSSTSFTAREDGLSIGIEDSYTNIRTDEKEDGSLVPTIKLVETLPQSSPAPSPEVIELATTVIDSRSIKIENGDSSIILSMEDPGNPSITLNNGTSQISLDNKNIYRSNGTIESNRTVNVNSKSLSFESGSKLNMDFSSSLNSLSDSVLKIKGNNTGTGIGVFIGNVWSNLFASTGVYVNAGSSGYVNGFDIIGRGSSVGGGITGRSSGVGTGLYLNGETQNSNSQFPGIRLRGKNTGGTFDDLIIEPMLGKMSILNIPQNSISFIYGESSSGRMTKIPYKDPIFWRGSDAFHEGSTEETVVKILEINPRTWVNEGLYTVTCAGTKNNNITSYIRMYFNTIPGLTGSPIMVTSYIPAGDTNPKWRRMLWKSGDIFESAPSVVSFDDVMNGSNDPLVPFTIDSNSTIYAIFTIQNSSSSTNISITNINLSRR